jgi:hypothetical protein
MKNSTKLMSITVVTAALFGCAIPPTPYQTVAEGQINGFGYTSIKVDDALYRVTFQGNRRTSRRAIDAYVLYRAAEIAKEVSAPAFVVLEGKVDRSVLDGDDKFASIDGRPIDFDSFDSFDVARSDDGAGPPDQVMEIAPLRLTRTGSFGPVFVPRSMPMPSASVPRTTNIPTYIYTPARPVVFPQESLLVRMLPSLPTEADAQTFLTQDVLTRIGHRIVRKPLTS